MLAADAGTMDSAVGAVPADVVLLCGIFGNITDDDTEGTIRATRMLCAPGATVLWTRHRRQPDVVPRILTWFAAAGFAEIDVVMPAGSMSTIGSHRLSAPPKAVEPRRHLFSFVR